MKRTIHTIALASVVAIASLSQAAIAQTGRPSSKIDVPFAFDYGTQHFPAGVYIISMPEENILTVSSSTRSAWAMIQAGYDPTHNKSGYVVFRKYGDRYFLTEYGPASGNIHVSVSESNAERRTARAIATDHLTPTRVELALLTDDSDRSK